MKFTGQSLWIVISLIVLSGAGLLLFSTTSLDDVFITYWPAYSLVEFGELVNYNGERVEQSSSLVHVLLLAILFAVTSIPLPVLGYLVAIFSGLACIVAGERLCRQLNSTPVFMSLLVLATSPYMVYWSRIWSIGRLIALRLHLRLC
jgi:D-alanyl-lipoteichoic acid acyltransferase DltB (MBOAT superfamily)